MDEAAGVRPAVSGTEEVAGVNEFLGVREYPPVLFAGTLLGGILLNRVLPIPFLPRGTERVAGSLFGLAGVLLGLAAIREMRRAGTSPTPDIPVRALVTTGPYRYSRNPIYLAGSLLYAGGALFANALWPLLLFPALLAGISATIDREERYLTRRFGERYREYTARVRRWL